MNIDKKNHKNMLMCDVSDMYLEFIKHMILSLISKVICMGKQQEELSL